MNREPDSWLYYDQNIEMKNMISIYRTLDAFCLLIISHFAGKLIKDFDLSRHISANLIPPESRQYEPVVQSFLFVGQSGVVTHCHVDAATNLFVQVVGMAQ
jgi:hypothetical protein